MDNATDKLSVAMSAELNNPGSELYLQLLMWKQIFMKLTTQTSLLEASNLSKTVLEKFFSELNE